MKTGIFQQGLLLAGVAMLAGVLPALGQAPACPTGADKTRVTGGTDVSRGDYPYQAFIRYRTMRCGGTLVARDTILTAAHCVTFGKTSMKLPAGEITVRLGSIDAFSGGNTHAVSAVVVHENYDPVKLTNDIALLRLAGPAVEKPVRLDGITSDGIAEEKMGEATVLGWGLTNPNERYSASDVLKLGRVPVVPLQTCAAEAPAEFRPFGPIDDRRICAGGAGPVDTCGGDSGGPLIVRDAKGRDVQVGVTSFGLAACGTKGVPGVYTRVASFRQFLVDSVGARNFAAADDEKPDLMSAPMNALLAAPGQQGVQKLSQPVANTDSADSIMSLRVWVDGTSDAPLEMIPGVVPATSRAEADFTWQRGAARVLRRNVLVAEGVTDLGRLSGVLARWRVLPQIEALASRFKPLKIEFRTPPATGTAYADAEQIDMVFRRPAGPGPWYLTVIDLTSDGSLDYLYPGKPDDSGEMFGDYDIRSKVQCPFGTEHLIAFATRTPPIALRRHLQGDLARLNAPVPMSVYLALRDRLPPDSIMGLLELRTTPRQ